MPFINYMDERNTTFLEPRYLDQIHLIRKSSTQAPITCDHSSIEDLLVAESIRMTESGSVGELRDLAFVGRSNVGKSSLINALLGVELT